MTASTAHIIISISDTYFARETCPEVLRRIHHDFFQIRIAQVEALDVERFIKF